MQLEPTVQEPAVSSLQARPSLSKASGCIDADMLTNIVYFPVFKFHLPYEI